MPESNSTPKAPHPAEQQRLPQRVRHELRFRQLTVLAREQLSPHVVRIICSGDALGDFSSPGFDDHCKLVFPDPETGQLILPAITSEGVVWPDGPRPAARDYTPHHHDPRQGLLAFDFALHDAGPATTWALRAKPGDALGVGGPRGSLLIPTCFDWHLLAGDETALPAIGRRLRELPPDARAQVFILVDSSADEQSLPCPSHARIHWIHRRSGNSSLLSAIEQAAFPDGDFHAWVACEAAEAKAIRTHLIEARGANPKWLRAAAYWRRGSAAAHETYE
ncbi:siderophore-interacting protein [Corticibacter populi]|uniref:Siderophore-interacting protein n=1 Tax=Corticibacter populi TaxID=1550736 RepID=A0A3M6QYN8_9BURK|nr:siderophore-interacting protein [Corticibacter populi]RMX08127.1 siderophore-interacting protein [Corticibacter populi]